MGSQQKQSRGQHWREAQYLCIEIQPYVSSTNSSRIEREAQAAEKLAQPRLHHIHHHHHHQERCTKIGTVRVRVRVNPNP